jgi:hypothetical protein
MLCIIPSILRLKPYVLNLIYLHIEYIRFYVTVITVYEDLCFVYLVYYA